MAGKKLTLEEKFAKLEETARMLEQEDISLAESFRLYKEGMELLKQCNAEIEQVEKQVLLLNADGGTEVFGERGEPNE